MAGGRSSAPPLPPQITDPRHVPYPASALDLLPPKASKEVAPSTIDPINRFPQEVRDLIFSQLPIASLDAARYVSRAWYQWVMTNGWMLDRVLEQGSSPGRNRVYWDRKEYGTSSAEGLRHLARDLDLQSKLTNCGSRDEAWKVRYRRCDMTYAMVKRRETVEEAGQGPSAPQGEARQITFAGISKSGTFAAFICVENRSGDDDLHTIHVYHFAYSGKPELVKSIPCPQGKGTPVMVELSEGESAGSWMAEVTFSGYKTTHLFNSPQLSQFKSRQGRSSQVTTTSVEPVSKSIPHHPDACQRQGQRTNCCHYHDRIIGKANDTKDIVDFREEEDWVCIEHHQVWVLLEKLPIVVGSRDHFIARNEETGDLCIVRTENRTVEDTSTEEEVVIPVVLLTRPHRHASYTNFAVAPSIRFDVAFAQQVLRVAVLWHEAGFPATEKVGLYIYDVVCLRDAKFNEQGNIIDGPRSFSRGWWVRPDGTYEPRSTSTARGNNLGELFDHVQTVMGKHELPMRNLKGCVSGKRICSFEPGMGGLHVSVRSSHQRSRTSRPPSHTLGSIRLIGDGAKRCMIWGTPGNPSKPTEATLTILEFGRAWRMDEIWELSLPLDDLGKDLYNRDIRDRYLHSCACASHDFKYHIVFPNAEGVSGSGLDASGTFQATPGAKQGPTKNTRPLSLPFWPSNSANKDMAYIAARARSASSPPASVAGQITSYHTRADQIRAARKAAADRQAREIQETQEYLQSLEGRTSGSSGSTQESLPAAAAATALRPSRVCPGGGWARRVLWWRQAAGSTPL